MTDHHTSTNGSRPGPVQSYLIASTPRSGSTLLCEALTNTGVAGRPEEYYQHRRKTGLPRRPREYFEDAETPEIVSILGGYTRIDDEYHRSSADAGEARPVRPRPTPDEGLDPIVELHRTAAYVCRQLFDHPCALLRQRPAHFGARDDVLDRPPDGVALDEPIKRLLGVRAREGLVDG